MFISYIIPWFTVKEFCNLLVYSTAFRQPHLAVTFNIFFMNCISRGTLLWLLLCTSFPLFLSCHSLLQDVSFPACYTKNDAVWRGDNFSRVKNSHNSTSAIGTQGKARCCLWAWNKCIQSVDVPEGQRENNFTIGAVRDHLESAFIHRHANMWSRKSTGYLMNRVQNIPLSKQNNRWWHSTLCGNS